MKKLVLLAFATMIFPCLTRATVAVNTCWNVGASSGTSLALTVAPTNGDTLIVAIAWPNITSTFTSLKDNAGTSLTQDSLIQYSTTATTMGFYHESNVSSVTSVTLVISVYDAQMIIACDVSGLTNSSPADAFSASSSASGTGNPYSVASVTTGTSGDLVIGLAFARASAHVLTTSGSWVVPATGGSGTGTGDGITFLTQVVSSATGYTPQGGNAGGFTFVGISGSYKAGAAATSPTSVPVVI